MRGASCQLLIACLPFLPGRTNCASLGELLYRVKTDSKLLAAQLRIECKGEVQALLAEIDSIKREVEQREGTCWDLQQQVKALQDGRREMLAEMARMVPRSELGVAREEDGAADLCRDVEGLRGELVGLRSEAAAAQEERERLVSAMQVTPAHMNSSRTVVYSLQTIDCPVEKGTCHGEKWC